MSRSYAGIGSRSTPRDVREQMREFARLGAREGWCLRTGGASGADQAFLGGARAGRGEVELYLPWRGFRQLSGERLSEPSEGALKLAATVHPAWERCSDAARSLHGRNCHQVLGADLDDPVELVLCWTPDGSLDGSSRRSGGTGQALRIAAKFGVTVANLARPEHVAIVEQHLARA